MAGKSKTLSRRSFLKLTALGAIGLAFTTKRPPRSNSTLSYPQVIKSVPTPLPYFALTIDDGFDLDVLLEMVEILEKTGMTATFFMVGRYSIRAERKYPGIMKRMAENGNEIAYHTMVHEKPDGAWQLDYLIGDYHTWLGHHYEILGEELYYKAVKPFARAPWDNFSKPFLRMCQHERLLPVSWSNDPGSFNRGQDIVCGDIFLIHVRESDLAYLHVFAEQTGTQPVAFGKILIAEHIRSLSEQVDRMPNRDHLPQMK